MSDMIVTKTLNGDLIATETLEGTLNVGDIRYIDREEFIDAVEDAIEEIGLDERFATVEDAIAINLIPFPYADGTTKEHNGITFTVNEADGSIVANGTASGKATFTLLSAEQGIRFDEGKSYTLSGVPSGFTDKIYLSHAEYSWNGRYASYVSAISNCFSKDVSKTVTYPSIENYSQISIMIISGTVCDNLVFKPMLELGTVAHDYIRYIADGNKINEVVKSVADSKSDIGHTHDDRYYTESEINTKLSEKSDTNHTHDDRYYTESEVDTKLSGKSDTGHTHDDRYYTESEVDNKLSGKANSSHTHTKSQITDFPSSLPASDVYDWAKASSKPSYTASEVGASATGHKHTKSEITDFPSSMTPTAHNQAASTITAGTFGGQVVAPASTSYTTAKVCNINVVDTAPTDGASSSYPNGTITFVRA